MEESNISRRSLLRRGTFAATAGGFLGHATSGTGAPNGGTRSSEELGVEFLDGGRKQRLVSRVMAMDAFKSIHRELRSRGWRIARDTSEAFSVDRDLEYEGVIIGFKKRGAPHGTEAHFVHLQGELPESIEKTTYGHIGSIEDTVLFAGEESNVVEETHILPDGSGGVTTETTSFDPREEFGDGPVVMPDGGYAVTSSSDSCVICHQDCTVGWRCALTIVATGIGVVACTVAALLSGGLALALCLLGTGISALLAFDCVSRRDCEWVRRTVTRDQFEDLDNSDETTYQEYCEYYSCN